jgi:hypothetical protein
MLLAKYPKLSDHALSDSTRLENPSHENHEQGGPPLQSSSE